MTTLELLTTLINFKSITPSDDGAFEFIKEFLSEFKCIDINKNDTKNIFLYKTFGNGEHLSFAGHIDVVPKGDGWQNDPFEALFKDGFIYGRGAQDMKSGVCAMMQACKETKHFNGTLSIMLTSDEEGDGKDGLIEVLRHLKQKDFLPHFVVVAEPTSEKIFGDTIKIGRRGSINGILEIFGIQGHVAYPQKTINPIHKIAPILPKITDHFFDEGDAFFEPTRLVVTDIRSGFEVVNLTPNSLKLMFNIRNSLKTNIDEVEDYFEKILQGFDYKLNLKQTSKPFLVDKNSKIITCLNNAIKDVVNIAPKLSTSGGTSDAKLMGEFGIEVAEFGVINDTIHAANEKVSLKEVENLKKVFKRLIEIYNF